MSEGKIYHVALNLICLDLNKPDPFPAKFQLETDECHGFSSCYDTKLHYRALIKDRFYPECKTVCIHINSKGRFKFDIPDWTVGLEVSLTVPNGQRCQNGTKCASFVSIKEYFPSVSKTDFTDKLAVTRQVFLYCNRVAVDTSGLDHTPVKPGDSRQFGHQLGPCRSARAMAIVHIAMFEVFNTIHPSYKSYLGFEADPCGGSADSGIGQAMYETLVYLFPSHQNRLHKILEYILGQIPDCNKKVRGIQLGKTIAQSIITLRRFDGSNHPEPIIGVNYFPSDAPGQWRQDPISKSPIAMGADWYKVLPFVIARADQFRVPTPPALTSEMYMMAFDEVKSVGGDGVITPTVRSELDTETGLFWAYDGTPSLCAPPRLYNQITVKILLDQGVRTSELARTVTKIHVGMADTALTCWESKYFYKGWRPICAIREADPGTGPSGEGDGNTGTKGDITWTPLGAPASNSQKPNFTPPFPACPSGHASFGGCIFQFLRNFFGTDNIQFTFVSDELNGITVDNKGNVRPYKPRTYDNFTTPEDENGQSRMYLGIHFSFEKLPGIIQGNQVANYLEDRLYYPLKCRQ